MKCPHCISIEVVKIGYYFTKSGKERRRYRCKVCGRTFVPNPIKPRNALEVNSRMQ